MKALRVVSSQGEPEAVAGLREHPAQRQGRPGPEAASPGGAVTPLMSSHFENIDSVTALIPGSFPCPLQKAGAFLCDRMTVVFPLLVPPGLKPDIGLMWLVDGAGIVESFRHRRRMVEGSWTSKVSIEVHDCAIFDADLCSTAHQKGLEVLWLRLDGNPVKFFQGWNAFGTPDVWGLTKDFVSAVLEIIGLGKLSGAELWLHRGYFNRLDATFNFDLGSEPAAASLVRQLGRLASVSHRRASGFATSLLFPGQSSSLSIYHKGPEMRAHPPKNEVPGLLSLADRIVRFEVVSRSARLDAFGLRSCGVWAYGALSVSRLFDLWLSFVRKLRFPVMADVDLSALSPSARRMYAAWFSGLDVFSMASQATAYRHRGAILKVGGPDIFLPKPDGDIISFRRVLSPVPVTIPADIAALMYEPRAA